MECGDWSPLWDFGWVLQKRASAAGRTPKIQKRRPVAALHSQNGARRGHYVLPTARRGHRLVFRTWPDGSYPAHSFIVTALLAVVIVSLICGSVGSLVIGNRMAFFSDALAHCAFAGVGLGILIAL